MNIRSLQRNNNSRPGASNQRMGALATLPVFYKLQDKKALVAGGSDAAAWKAELLAAAGAVVHVFAEKLDPAFISLIARPSVSGAFIWHKRPWSGDSFTECRSRSASASTMAKRRRSCAAPPPPGVHRQRHRQAGALVRLPVRFIVNRSPAVIAISTRWRCADPWPGHSSVASNAASAFAGAKWWRNWPTPFRSCGQSAGWRHGGARRGVLGKFSSTGRFRRGAGPGAPRASCLLGAACAGSVAWRAGGQVTLASAPVRGPELLTLKSPSGRCRRRCHSCMMTCFGGCAGTWRAARPRRMLVGKRVRAGELHRQDDITRP